MVETNLNRLSPVITEANALNPGEIYISHRDAEIVVSKDTILLPNEVISLKIEKPDFPSFGGAFTVRSVFAQAGIDCLEIDESGKAKIANFHPTNKYLFPEGRIRLGRYYKTSGISLVGEELEALVSQINTSTNTFDVDKKPVIVGDQIHIRFVEGYYIKPRLVQKDDPINVSSFPSGSERSKVKFILGNRDSDRSYDPKYPDGRFRLLVTPLITVPEGYTLVIQNQDSLHSKVIDSGFEHMIVGEFSANLMIPPLSNDLKTTDILSLKAYKLKI